MRLRALVVPLLLLSIVAVVGAQSSPKDASDRAQTQARGYWVDPSTGLMWSAKNNGKAVTWSKAGESCRGLRLAGYSDWRLGTLDELASLVLKRASGTEHSGSTTLALHGAAPQARGDLALTGDPWSSNREINRFGKPYGDGWFSRLRHI